MEQLVTAVFGIICIVIGIINRKGNVSMLHSYHRNRVSEQEKLPFGKMVGLGMIILGIALILSAGLTYLSVLQKNGIYETIAYIVTGIGFVVGIGISFYAMIKYNKGIF